jgi:hypothetical protein
VLLLYGSALFLGAFLLFLVQPMVAKMVLPLLGGAPAVWNTCMVFFQAVLLAGYAYAHWLPARLGARRHVPIHLAVLALPLLLLPLRVASSIPPVTERPVPWLLGLLVVMVGAPAFALATTAPLLQRWFTAGTHRQRHDPYFLYAASNLGSLAALIGYPFVIEPRLKLATQNHAWSAGYALLLALVAGCAWVAWRGSGREAGTGAEAAAGAAPASTSSPAAERPLTRTRVLRWIALALAPSSLMLGVTTYSTTDIAPIPLFWVVPLALYLLTYIIAFSRPHPAVHRVAITLLPVAIVALVIAHRLGTASPIGARIAFHLAAFFDAALVCHGELAATRPASRHLTAFYLWLSVGGALGGVLNALIAPLLFPCIVEYPLMIALVAMLRPRVARAVAPRPRGARAVPVAPGAEPTGRLGWAWSAFGALAGLVFLVQAFGAPVGVTLELHRDFFGIIRVRTDAEHRVVGLQHGTTLHGLQDRTPALRQVPLGYYSRLGPMGQTFAAWDSLHRGRPVGVVGLGAGTLACYARPGQVMTFYEIDPAIERVARDTSMFTYLADAEARGARLRVVLGDARLRLRQSNERYDLLVLDAFSSDAIPVHLLTREALRVDLDHLAPDGILAVHFSSRYVKLDPALAALARGANLACRIQDDAESDSIGGALEHVPSRWVVMARGEAALGNLVRDPRWNVEARPASREWTDDYSSLASLIQWGAYRSSP